MTIREIVPLATAQTPAAVARKEAIVVKEKPTMTRRR
jgi:hypothetical protein